MVRILDEADFGTDGGLMDAVHLLGLVMQGFVEGLHVRGNENESDDVTDLSEN